ncbi:MAG: DNA polymerase I [Spirochaetota bacterium]|nr:MAG: DNA polymerase I [Spirochaetota bacterium]
MEERLYIIDGHGLVYRAYYAFIRRPLVTTKGENTSALFGFMRMILKLIQDESPQYIVCVFDSKEPTFRHKLYPAYKAKRLKAPEDLISQVETIKTLIDKLGISVIEVPGYEADDLIGTITDKAKSEGMKCTIVSSDKDVLQLVDKDVNVYASRKGVSDVETLNEQKVFETWGVQPARIVDLFTLMGDQSDNVPGVKGIGKSGALKLVKQFKSFEELFDNIESIGEERTRGLLQKGREDAVKSRGLVTIRKDVPIEFSKEDFLIEGFPKKEGVQILVDKELNSVVEELVGADFASLTMNHWETRKEEKRGNYLLITTREDFASLKKRIMKKGIISFDTESTGKDPIESEVIGVSISIEEGEGAYIPIVSKTGKGLGVDFLVSELKEILENEGIKKVGQNLKYDFIILMKYGIFMKGIDGDAMIASYLLNPQQQRYNLDDLAKEWLDYVTIKYTDIVKEKDKTLLDYPLEDVVVYACEDSDIALRLNNLLKKRLEKENLLSLYRDIEIPLVSVLGRMESAGVKIDSDYLKNMSIEFGSEIKTLEEEIYEIAGEQFNIRSTKQLASVLFEKLRLPVIKRTKTGISTDESVLRELSNSYDIAQYLLRHRTLSKLKSTYIDSLPAMINPRTGRIHTSFNQTITTTGRLSSAGPNLQNIPIREKEGRAIRRAFIPEEDYRLVSADYSQIELRILASLSKDRVMIDTFKKDGDIHRETASILFGLDANEVSDEQRAVAKTINFSIIYGMSPFGLSKRLGISNREAGNFIEMYFQKYSGVKEFFESTVEKAKRDGYVETMMGRIRWVPAIQSQNRNIFEAARRVAVNTPIQGTAADLIKKAMVEIDREITQRGLKSRMLIQVHDELVFEVPSDELETLKRIARERMEGALVFDIPLRVNVAVGNNWEEAH